MFHAEDVAVVKGLPPLNQQFPPPIKNEETWADMLRLLLASRLARVERAHGAGTLPSAEVLSSLSAFSRVAPSAAAAPEGEGNADAVSGEARDPGWAEPSGTLVSPYLKAQESAADVDPRQASAATAPPASVEPTTLDPPEDKEALKRLEAAAEQARREAEDRAAASAAKAREEAVAALLAARARAAEAEAEAAACRAAVEAAQCQKHELVLQLRRRLTEKESSKPRVKVEEQSQGGVDGVAEAPSSASKVARRHSQPEPRSRDWDREWDLSQHRQARERGSRMERRRSRSPERRPVWAGSGGPSRLASGAGRLPSESAEGAEEAAAVTPEALRSAWAPPLWQLPSSDGWVSRSASSASQWALEGAPLSAPAATAGGALERRPSRWGSAPGPAWEAGGNLGGRPGSGPVLERDAGGLGARAGSGHALERDGGPWSRLGSLGRRGEEDWKPREAWRGEWRAGGGGGDVRRPSSPGFSPSLHRSRSGSGGGVHGVRQRPLTYEERQRQRALQGK